MDHEIYLALQNMEERIRVLETLEYERQLEKRKKKESKRTEEPKEEDKSEHEELYPGVSVKRDGR